MNLYDKYILTEQGMPPGMPGMPGQGGQPEKSTEDKLFEKVRDYPKIDALIQQMQQQNYSDSKILDTIYKKFHPEFVYFAKEIIQTENKPKPPQPPGGMPGGMPGGPGAGGPPGQPMGAGGQ